VLRVWRERRGMLAAPSPRPGCARVAASVSRAPRAPGARIWQSFSGNNSGECALVAKFDDVGDAERVLAELLPGYAAGEAYGAPWKELFACEDVAGPAIDTAIAPDEMVAFGRALLARTESAPGDDFPELRALAWKRGGEVIAGGVHVHEPTTGLVAVRAVDDAARAAVLGRARALGAPAVVHGPFVLVALAKPGRGSADGDGPLAWLTRTAAEIAGGRAVGMEIHCDAVDEAALVHAAQRLGEAISITPRLVAAFWGMGGIVEGIERATRFAADAEGEVTRSGNLVLVDGLTRKKRLATHVLRMGGGVASLHGDEVLVNAMLWREAPKPTKGTKAPAPPAIDVTALEGDLVDRFRRSLAVGAFTVEHCKPASWGGRVDLQVRTTAPAAILEAIEAHARDAAMSHGLGIEEARPLELALRRVIADAEAVGKASR